MLLGYAGPGLPTTAGAYKIALAAGSAEFVARSARWRAARRQLLAAIYFGVDNPQRTTAAQGNTGFALALDGAGAPWFTGQACTTNLPVTIGAVQAAPAAMSSTCAAGPGPWNSFGYVAKLSARSRLAGLCVVPQWQDATRRCRLRRIRPWHCRRRGRQRVRDRRDRVGCIPDHGRRAADDVPEQRRRRQLYRLRHQAQGGRQCSALEHLPRRQRRQHLSAAVESDAGASAIWTTSVTGGEVTIQSPRTYFQRVHGGGGADAGIVQPRRDDRSASRIRPSSAAARPTWDWRSRSSIRVATPSWPGTPFHPIFR